MTQSMNAVLSAVQARLWRRRLMHGVLRGLVCGALFAIALAGFCLMFNAPQLAGAIAAFAVAVGAAVGVGIGLLRRPNLRSAAEVVDEYYAMKDRTVSALAFAAEPVEDPMRRLQLADTEAHLRKVRPRDCVSVSISPAIGSWTVVLLSITIGVVAYSRWMLPTAAATRPIPLAEQQAERLRSTVLAEIETLAEETDSEELRQLSEELEQLAEVLDQQVTDKEAYFATLSAMEQAITTAQDKMQLRQNEKRLHDIAAAIKPADAMRAAADAVEAEDYERAAREFEAMDPSELSEQERRAVAENLKKLQPRETDSESNQLEQATKQLEQALGEKNDDQARAASEQMSDAAKQQAVAETIEESMRRQMNRLADAKGQGRNNGQTPSETAQKTERPSQTWGNAASGNPQDGESAQLASARERQQLTGQKGEGSSEKESIESTATEQVAQREYAKRYQAYRRQAEAVLESEPLPIGHRETIRRYFESIRPQTPQ